MEFERIKVTIILSHRTVGGRYKPRTITKTCKTKEEAVRYIEYIASLGSA